MSRKTRPNKISNQNKDSPQSLYYSSQRNFQNFVTTQQETLASQASVYTHKTTRSRTVSLPDQEDFFQEENHEQMKEVFISEEEEKVIQKILQIARKGKISQNNAFQIPLKVVDNDDTTMIKGRFWKFASQLLGASINIYDKRIQNAWTNTNKVHNKLMRINIGKAKEEEERDDQLSSRPSNEFVLVSDIYIPENIDYKNIGSQTLQNTQRISLTNLNKHFINDPLFFKKLKTFDKANLKSLLLNVFDLKNNLEVKLFDNNQQEIEKINTHNEYIQEIKEDISIKKSLSIFSQITNKRKELIQNQQQNNNKKQLQDQLTKQAIQESDFAQQFKQFDELYQKEIINLQEKFQMPYMPIQNTQQIDYNQDLRTEQISNPIEYHSITNSPISQASKSIYSNPLFGANSGFFTQNITQDIDKDNLTTMMPWQLEIRLNKLNKKRIKSNNPMQRKKKQVNEFQIQFDQKIVQNPKLIFQLKKNIDLPNIEGKQKNLLPKNLVVHERYNKKKIQYILKYSKIQVYDSQYAEQDHPTFLQNQHPQLENQNRISQIRQLPQQEQQHIKFEDNQISFFKSSQLKTEQENERFRRYYQRNIRQVKEFVFQQLNNQRQLNLSQMNSDMMLSAQSMLITFLHLANQKNLVVQNNQDESDVCLSWQ